MSETLTYMRNCLHRMLDNIHAITKELQALQTTLTIFKNHLIILAREVVAT